MARRKINLEDFERMEIDPATGQLFWEGHEVVTVIALPAIVNYAIVVATIVAVLSLALAVLKYLGIQPRRGRE